MRSTRIQIALLIGIYLLRVDGFLIRRPTLERSQTTKPSIDIGQSTEIARHRVLNAGFGGGSPKKKKETKIKPKQQWDRYSGDLKKEKPYRVAVKAEGKESDEWLEVGNVKSKENKHTVAAVARQKALIAEVRSVSAVNVASWRTVRFASPQDLMDVFFPSIARPTFIPAASLSKG